MSNPLYFIGLGYEGASALRTRTDACMLTLAQQLIGARLLVQEQTLMSGLDDTLERFDSACEVVHEAADSFWESRPPRGAWLERASRWDDYIRSCQRLQDESARQLMPTIRDQSARQRPLAWSDVRSWLRTH
jgi:hypothetical protein